MGILPGNGRRLRAIAQGKKIRVGTHSLHDVWNAAKKLDAALKMS